MPRRQKIPKKREPLRTYLCSDETYESAQAAAEDDGQALAEVIRQYLVRYTRSVGRRTGRDYHQEWLDWHAQHDDGDEHDDGDRRAE